MIIALDEIERWFQDRQKWLQDAARRLIQNGTLTEQDDTDLLTLCTQEASGQTATFSGIPSGALGVVDTTKPLRLESISDIQGINALSPRKPLPLGKAPLCIVYGRKKMLSTTIYFKENVFIVIVIVKPDNETGRSRKAY